MSGGLLKEKSDKKVWGTGTVRRHVVSGEGKRGAAGNSPKGIIDSE